MFVPVVALMMFSHITQSVDSSFRYNVLFKASESCSISLCSSHCAVVAQWIKSLSHNMNVESCLYRDLFATSEIELESEMELELH